MRTLCGSIQHILNKDAISRCGVVDQDVGDSADELAVLNDRRAAYGCVNIGPTLVCP